MNITCLWGSRSAATKGLASLLALACLACSPCHRHALPTEVASHFESATAWDVYQIEWAADPGRRLSQVAGYRFDGASRKVTLVGEKLVQMRSAIGAGIEAKACNPPEIAAVLAPEYLVAARHDGRDMALVFQFGEAPRIDYYTGDKLESGAVNSDSASREIFLQLFQPQNKEQAR